MNTCAHVGSRGDAIGRVCNIKASHGLYCLKHKRKTEKGAICAHIGTRGNSIGKVCNNQAKYNGYCMKHRKVEPKPVDLQPDNFDTTLARKICTSCNVEKESTAFPKNKSVCKGCSSVKCTLCDAVFADVGTLKVHHEGQHLGLRPYSCPKCTYTCKQKGSLKLHRCDDRRESYYQKLLQEKYQSGSKTTPAGIIDILTQTELIEIKHWIAWKSAIGQVMAYSRYYPDHKKIIYFIGNEPRPATKQVIMDTLEFYGIEAMVHVDEQADNTEQADEIDTGLG